MFEDNSPISNPAGSEPADLSSVSDLSLTVVNERVVIRDDPTARWRVILVSGVVYGRYSRTDAVSERQVCVQLRLSGLASQAEVVAAFGHVRSTQCRWERLYRQMGLAGLFTQPALGRRSVMPKNVEDAVVTLHGQGCGMRRIAAGLGLTLHQVEGVYKRRHLTPHLRVARDGSLFEDGVLRKSEETEKEAAGGSLEPESGHDDEVGVPTEPWDGWLQPEYQSENGVPWAGVLLALPVLEKHRVLEVFSELYRTLGFWAIYGLQTMVTLMVSLALWRIKRPEHLKGFSPQELGKVLGLPRAPEVKTVRRKLGQLARREQAREAMLKLADVRIRQEEDLLGYLYVDGHVRIYSGKYDLAKGYSTQRHMPVRATTDTWANDRNGDPVFLVTSEVNEGLVQMLKPVLGEARALAGEQRRITVIFDRGGWSPQLFVELIRDGFDIITYRKGRTKDLAEEGFEKRTVTIANRQVTYWLCDQYDIELCNGKLDWGDGVMSALHMRQVTRLNRQTGHQTKVLTTRRDLEPEMVLWRMFARWRQENFFKYMLEEFAVDGLVEYGSEPVDPNLERPNPEHRRITKEIAALKAEILRLQGQRCELIGDRDTRRANPPGFERYLPANQDAKALAQQIRETKTKLKMLQAKREGMPERISAGDLERLQTERQLLATVFKVAAYRIETELVRMVAPYYARTEEEGRKLIAAALHSTADLEVTKDELRVTLAPQSSPHRSRGIAALCADLNKLGTVVPGTNLRLILDCAINLPSDVSF
jgi:hypothetical protein